jgi:hypothetical protein
MSKANSITRTLYAGFGRSRAALAVLLGLLPACPNQVDPSLSTYEISPNGSEKYDVTLDPSGSGTVVVTAEPDNPSGTSRDIFWRNSDPVGTDQQSCATWAGASGNPFHQEGAVLRLHLLGEGNAQAITVTKNVYGEDFYLFNIHVWDTRNTAAPFTKIATFDLSAIFGGERVSADGDPIVRAPLRPFPWRICAKAVGDLVSFVVWPLPGPQPDWDDPRYGGSARVPSEFVVAGQAGWYFGHLQPGSSLLYSDLTISNAE